MKPPRDRRPHAPQLPAHLQPITVVALTDEAEFLASSLSGCDYSGQSAKNMVLQQTLLQRVILGRTRLPRIRLTDVRMEGIDLSGADWEKARCHRVEFTGCRLVGLQLTDIRATDILIRDCNLEGVIVGAGVFRSARFENCASRPDLAKKPRWIKFTDN